MCEDSIKLYLEQLGSSQPTPGGGSASAVVGALGAALLEKACNLTIGKEKFKAVEKDIQQVLEKVLPAKARLIELVDLDKTAYLPVAKAYKMPKDTGQQKEARKQAIDRAMEAAKKVPLEIKKICEGLFAYCGELEKKANPLLISDVRCAKELLEAAARAAQNFM